MEKQDNNNGPVFQNIETLEGEIQAWKAKYGAQNVHQLDIPMDEGVETYVIRKPGRKEIDAMAQHKVNKDVTKANNVLIANCILHGNKEVLERDGDVYAEILVAIQLLVKKREAIIKKL